MKLLFRADDGDVNSHQVCELPIIGPGIANRLVMITGLANTAHQDGAGLDVLTDDIASFDVEITTNYRLGPHDNWQGIAADDPQRLAAATFVSLATVGADDEDAPGTPTGFVLALNEVLTRVNELDARAIVIHIKVGMQGDSTLGQIAFAANLLIQKVA